MKDNAKSFRLKSNMEQDFAAAVLFFLGHLPFYVFVLCDKKTRVFCRI
jgi:hypothetical protein